MSGCNYYCLQFGSAQGSPTLQGCSSVLHPASANSETHCENHPPGIPFLSSAAAGFTTSQTRCPLPFLLVQATEPSPVSTVTGGLPAHTAQWPTGTCVRGVTATLRTLRPRSALRRHPEKATKTKMSPKDNSAATPWHTT